MTPAEKAAYTNFQTALRALAYAEKELQIAQEKYRQALVAMHPFALEPGKVPA